MLRIGICEDDADTRAELHTAVNRIMFQYTEIGKNVVEDVTYDYDNGYESTQIVAARRGSIKIHNTGKGVD